MNEEFVIVEEKLQSSKYIKYTPTLALRWLKPKEYKEYDTSKPQSIAKLQQKWISDDLTKSIWRDIPTEIE